MLGVLEADSESVIGGLGDGLPVKGEPIYLLMRDGMEFDKERKVITMCSNGVIQE